MQNLFFNDNAPSHKQCLFSGQLRFHRSYFFRAVSNPSEQPILHISWFDTAATFSEQLSFQSATSLKQLLYQNSCFFSAIFFPRQLLVWSETYSNCFFELLFQTKYFYATSDCAEQLLFQRSYFIKGGTFSGELLFQKINRTQDLLFQGGYFLRAATFSEELLLQHNFSQEVLLNSSTSFSQLHFLSFSYCKSSTYVHR